MLKWADMSIAFLAGAFMLSFLGSFLNIAFTTYLSGMGFILSLYFYKKMTPFVFLAITSFSLLLFVLSSSPYILAAIFPLIGLLFAGENRSQVEPKGIARYALLGTSYLIFAIYYALAPEEGTASHNQLSVIIVYAILSEILFFREPSRFYLPLIFTSFLLFGNRSSIFLLAVFIKNKIVLYAFLLLGAFFIGIVYKLIDPPPGFESLFDIGGLLYRSYEETRGDYIGDFFSNFNLFNLHYDKWVFYDVPQTATGFPDLHNSLLTIIVRDSYLGLFKVILWTFQIFALPFGVFIGITMRATHDTFLLGGINDIVLYALIGRSIRNFCLHFRVSMNYHQSPSIMLFFRKSI